MPPSQTHVHVLSALRLSVQSSQAEGAVLGVQTVPLEPVSAPNPNITPGCGSPLLRHCSGSCSTLKYSPRVRQKTSRGRRPDAHQLPRSTLCGAGVSCTDGKTELGSLSEGSSTANSKLPKRQLLQIVCKRPLH